MKKIVCVLLVCALALSLMSGCTAKSGGGVGGEDILSQKVTEKGRTQISVLVKYAFSIHAFEQAVEEKFPDIDLVQVGNYTSDRGLVEYERRLEHDDLTDMVMTWPLDVGEEYWSDRLLDLSGMSFTSRYNTSMLNTIARDGKLYYLPGPAQVRGIVYNKTLFAEKGWAVPTDFDGFVELCKTIEASGLRSLQLGFGNSEVLDTAFVGFGYSEAYSTPQNAQARADYDSGKGTFGDNFGPALDTFQTMIDAGIWKAEDLKITYSDRERMLFSRQCAMVEDSVLMARMGYSMTGTTDEFALMPFFTDGAPSDWARLYMVCYIGLNKHLAENANKQKYDLVMKLMDYISTPEGQEALAADTGAMYSSLTGVPASEVPEIDDMRDTLNAGRSAIFPELKNAQGALRAGLAGMVGAAMTKEDVIRAVDAANTTPPAASNAEVLGKAEADFSLIETGNFITDVMREKAGSDFALFLDNGKDGRYNGLGVSGKIYQGEQTGDDLVRIMPDFKRGEAGSLQVATMTGEDLKKTLEYAVAVDNDSSGWFYYFSGLKMTYAPAAEPGSRIKKIETADGEAIDDSAVYTVAVMDSSVPEENTRSIVDTGLLIKDLLAERIKSTEAISPSRDGRFAVAQP